MITNKIDIPVHNLISQEFHYTTLENGHHENFDDIHRHNFYEIIWFEKVTKTNTLFIDFEKFDVYQNQIFFIKPRQVFSMRLNNEKGHVFAIGEELFNRITEDASNIRKRTSTFSVSEENEQDCRTVISLLIKEYQKKCRNDLLESYLKSFFLLIFGDTEEKISLSVDAQRVEMLECLIDEYFTIKRDSGFYAYKLNMSKHHLNYIVKKLRGLTVKKMILQRLLLEAKRELSFGNKSIKEVSFELGFSDSSYFSRFFKQNTDTNPEDLRKPNN